MARLPIPGSDDNQWGEILNDFLLQSHEANGSLRASAVQPLIPDATTTSTGAVQLAGDLGGTATTPIVPDLVNKADTSDLVAHEESPLGTGVHGMVVHNWQQDGWAPFTPVTMTSDDPQQFIQSVSNGRGVLTPTKVTNGNLRVAYLLDKTEWADSEMRSVIWGPTGPWDANNAQQGHIHRVREISPGVYEGIAIWTSVVFGGDYRHLHANGVRFDGTPGLPQATAATGFGSSDSPFIDRGVSVAARDRVQFGGGVNRYLLNDPSRFQFVPQGAAVSVTGVSGTGFNVTDAAIGASAFNGSGRNITVADGDTVAWGLAGWDAQITPSAGDSQRRWTPFVLASRVIGGTESEVAIEAKRWRLGEPEPDWGDSRTRRGTTTSSANVPQLAVSPGFCALWGAHFHKDSGGAWGDIMCREL